MRRIVIAVSREMPALPNFFHSLDVFCYEHRALPLAIVVHSVLLVMALPEY